MYAFLTEGQPLKYVLIYLLCSEYKEKDPPPEKGEVGRFSFTSYLNEKTKTDQS